MIRSATLADAAEILRIEEECFASDRLSSRSIRHFLRSDRSRLFVYEQGAVIAGYILTLCHKRRRLGRHYSVAVLPQHRNRGIAEALVRRAERACPGKDGFKLEIRKDNGAARRLYERLGYRPGRLKPDYYQDGQDAIEMVKAAG
jgi:ribosomal protein S18 acetylase RimI-like enzyme